LFDRLPVLSFDFAVARVHSQLWARLVSKGTQLGERDLMIAATALAHGYQVVTRDLRSFPKIPGLATLNL
jgi:predicted nucleic acid-binding protein